MKKSGREGGGKLRERGSCDLVGCQSMSNSKLSNVSNSKLSGPSASRAAQVHTGVETWNATYSRLVNLRPPGSSSSSSNTPAAATAGGFPPRGAGQAAAAALPEFTVGADHTLQVRVACVACGMWCGWGTHTHKRVSFLL